MALQRLFVAIETPPAVRETIAGLLAPFRIQGFPVKWEQTGKLHITLRFIGETPAERIPGITAVLESAAGEMPGPFPVRYTSSGFFPDRQRPRILWIGVEDPGMMATRLHDAIEMRLRSMGLGEDDKKFHPHVTVGRIRNERPSSRLLEEFEKLTLHTDQVTVDQFVLMRSELMAEGSRYTIIGRFPLGGAARP